MKITKISYRALFNLGDYENEAIELFATVEEDEDLKLVVESLREKALSMAQPRNQASWDKRRELVLEIGQLNKKLQKAQADWEATTEFLRAQGIKTDAPSFPMLQNLLPQCESEVVDAEIDDDY